MASRKSGKKKKGKRHESSKETSPVSKTAFVRGFSHDAPAAEIVEKAKARGVSLTLSQVYDARSAIKKAELRAAKKKPAKAAAEGTREKTPAKAAKSAGSKKDGAARNVEAAKTPTRKLAKAKIGKGTASPKPSRSVEEAFLAAAFELGRARAQKLLDEFAREAREMRSAHG